MSETSEQFDRLLDREWLREQLDIAMLLDREWLSEVEGERDRYREALEEIAASTGDDPLWASDRAAQALS
jgi:hypothetical protein